MRPGNLFQFVFSSFFLGDLEAPLHFPGPAGGSERTVMAGNGKKEELWTGEV